MFRRLRVWLAVILCRGTGHVVCRTQVVNDLKRDVVALEWYVEKSGGLNDPRRIRVYGVVSNFAERVRSLVGDMGVGW